MLKGRFSLLFILLNTLHFLNAGADIVISNTMCNNRPVFFSYRDYFDDEIVFQKVQKNKDWYYISSSYPVLLIFSKEFSLYPLYAFPGDTIQVHCPNNPETAFEFYGNRQFESLNILSQIESRIGFLTPTLNIKVTNKLNLEYWLSALDSIHSERIAFLDSIFIKNNRETKLYREILKFRHLIDKLRPFYAADSAFDWRELPDNYMTMCRAFTSEMGRDSLIFDTKYRSLIWNYNKFLGRKVTGRSSDLELFQSAIENFTGTDRDYLLFRIIKKHINFFDPVSELMMIDFKKFCKNNRFAEYIDSIQVRMRNLPNNESVIYSKLKSLYSGSITFEQFLKKYKGKLIYIDFWASWCAPCINEISPLNDLKERFKENKVSFVSVSIDSDIKKWYSAIDKYDLNTEHQFLFDQENPLYTYFDLSAIPRFILIGWDGVVLTMNAPKPSDRVLVDETLKSALKLLHATNGN